MCDIPPPSSYVFAASVTAIRRSPFAVSTESVSLDKSYEVVTENALSFVIDVISARSDVTVLTTSVIVDEAFHSGWDCVELIAMVVSELETDDLSIPDPDDIIAHVASV